MQIPVENVLAAYPPTRCAAGLKLKPLTVGGALALAAMGVDFGKAKVEPAKLPLAVAVLAGILSPEETICGERRIVERAMRKAVRTIKRDFKAVEEAVETLLNDAFATRIKPAVPQGAPISFTPHGLGWPLRLAEQLCAEYGWPFEAALKTPLARAWALDACARERHGGKHGDFDYIERIEAERLRRKARKSANG